MVSFILSWCKSLKGIMDEISLLIDEISLKNYFFMISSSILRLAQEIIETMSLVDEFCSLGRLKSIINETLSKV